jgi:hypothetical protein
VVLVESRVGNVSAVFSASTTAKPREVARIGVGEARSSFGTRRGFAWSGSRVAPAMDIEEHAKVGRGVVCAEEEKRVVGHGRQSAWH